MNLVVINYPNNLFLHYNLQNKREREGFHTVAYRLTFMPIPIYLWTANICQMMYYNMEVKKLKTLIWGSEEFKWKETKPFV